jgi:hypothetical protein
VVTRFLPSGRRTISNIPTADKEGGGYAFDPKARSISPNNIEHAILHGAKRFTIERGEPRTIHQSGDLLVVTTRDERSSLPPSTATKQADLRRKIPQITGLNADFK